MIQDEIRTLLEAPSSGEEAPSLHALEDTLTTGYARALALEAERRRLERKIAEVTSALGGKTGRRRSSELADLSRRLSDADGDLEQLRLLLSSLRIRTSEVRATA
jgi:hypothetical protein